MEGMFALKRYGSDSKHHLSLVSPVDWSISATADLPFPRDEGVFGGSCDGLVYFQGQFYGTIVVCNLKTETWKVLTLPELPPVKVENVPNRDGTSTHEKRIRNYYEMAATGLGYDAESKDYKLIRSYDEYIDDESDDEEPGSTYAGCPTHTEVYSFNSASWEPVETPDAAIMYPTAIYCQGSCYWSAILDPTFGGLAYDKCRVDVLSFNFATNTFGHLPFPETEMSDSRSCRVVEYRGSLGALLYWGPEANDSSPLIVKLYVLKQESWCMLYDLTCENVERPLGLFAESDDGRILLFLEGKHDSRTSQLLAYDLVDEELEELRIYDLESQMIVIPFVPNEYRLPGSEPMTLVKSITTSEEDKLVRNLELKKRSTKIMRKKKNTVSSSSIYSVTAREIEQV